MKAYKVTVSPDAKEDLRKALWYLKYVLKNPQAARNVMDDYIETRKTLSRSAGSIQIPDQSSILGRRNLRRINLAKHDYFMLFRVEGDEVIITNLFHGLEDFENKLR